MSYAFLKKAQLQPDLSDFCEYVKKPVMVLEDILHRYEELQINKKVTTENLEIYHKCDSILQKHLPEMVDNFCNFSFEYRNNEKISIEDKSLTAKELLLKNLAKIIEEVKLIEKEFNYNNSFQTVVQTKILSNYGFQPQLSLESGAITQESVELNNQFDYDKFVEQNDFKKPSLSLEKVKVASELVDDDNDNATASEGGGGGLLSVILIGSVVMFFLILLFSAHPAMSLQKKQVAAPVSSTISVADAKHNADFLYNLANMHSDIKKLYAESNYSNLSIDELLKKKVITKEQAYTPWGSPIKIFPDQANNTFAIIFDSKKDDAKGTCELISNIVSQFEVTMEIDKDNIRTNTDHTAEEYKALCPMFASHNSKENGNAIFKLFPKEK
jgi:hypothetical protein